MDVGNDRFLGKYGYSCPPELQKTIEGMGFTETAVYFKERFSLPLSIEEIKQIWTEMSIDKYRNEVPLKPGAKEFLTYLKEHGIKAGIATRDGRSSTGVFRCAGILPGGDNSL